MPSDAEIEKRSASEMGKLQDIMIKQMEEQQKLKSFEKMASLLGITANQYLAMDQFEKYYRSRQNYGLRNSE
jgi:hypothetical protein